jgi:hypothetical protein
MQEHLRACGEARPDRTGLVQQLVAAGIGPPALVCPVTMGISGTCAWSIPVSLVQMALTARAGVDRQIPGAV